MEVYGDRHRDALVYLHGGPGASCLDFVNQAKALGEKLKVIIFDQLGVLRSDAIAENEDYSMEYQRSMNTEGITGEMWSKSERHMMKLLDDASGVQGTQKRVTMADNFLPIIRKMAVPLLLINGRYDPACTEYQTEFVMDNLPNAMRIVLRIAGIFPGLRRRTNIPVLFWSLWKAMEQCKTEGGKYIGYGLGFT